MSASTPAASIILLDAEENALTISWPAVSGAARYVLQYKPATNTDDNDNDYTTLSSQLTSTQARKKNLTDADGMGFFFRVGALRTSDNDEPDEWMTTPQPLHLLSSAQVAQRMSAPQVSLGGTKDAALVSWKAATRGGPYEIQMREAVGGALWQTIAASFGGTEVRKKNLISTEGYQFRVRTVASEEAPFSPPSEVVVSHGLSKGLQRLFSSLEGNSLLSKKTGTTTSQKISLEDALGGKEFVLLYASAHWCGPCRNFTPRLAQWYNSLGPNAPVEVVFVSADHDETGFSNYYQQNMPWLAVDYDEDTREELMGYLRVQGIPQLAVLDTRTGAIVERNVVGQPLDVQRWRSLRK